MIENKLTLKALKYGMKFFLCTFIVLMSNFSYSQHYLITQNKDTLFGKVRTWGLIFGRNLRIHTENGTQKINESNVYEYRIKNTFMFAVEHTPKGQIVKKRSMVLEFGSMRFLYDVASHGDSYFVYHQGTFYEVTRRYFSDEVWEILIQCPSFSDKYGSYRLENLNKNWMFFPKQENKWREMMRYYNQRCGRD